MRELLCKPATIFTTASIILTGIVLGVMVEVIPWRELPIAITISIIVGGLLLVGFLYWYGYKQYKKGRRHTRQIKKVKTTLWKMYKLAQGIAESAGKRGLTNQKLQEVKAKAQKELKVPSIKYQRAFTDEMATLLVNNLNKKMKHKMKNPVSVNKKTFQDLSLLSDVLDKSDVGLHSLLKEHEGYTILKEQLGEERVIAQMDSIKIKKVTDVSNTLNATLLSFMYFAPIYSFALPETKVPFDLFKDELDEMMQETLAKLGE